MVPTMSIKRAASIWSVSERRVNELCKTGRIEGAYKEDGRWFIPANTRKPVDERYKTKLPPRSDVKKLPLPVGVTDFKTVVSEYYYVDKTLLIRDILDEKSKISLFTRPRAFGKSLNMDMLKTFFEISSEDMTLYFRDKKIWSAGEMYRSYMGKYPVVYLDFRGVRFEKWDYTYEKIERIISEEFARHRELLDSESCSELEKKYFDDVIHARCTPVELRDAITILTKMLDEHYHSPVVVIIDEYDTPVVAGYQNGYYDEIKELYEGLIEEGLNENRHLAFAFIAGILTILNQGVKVNSVLDKKYGEYFGFTDDEVLNIIDYYSGSERVAPVRGWYSSYHFGDSDVYNPWSVLNYFNDECRLLPYWEMTGNNDVIDTFLKDSSLDMLGMLETMMQQKSIPARIDINVIEPKVDDSDPCALYSYMLAHGFLKATRAELQFDGDYMCDITIPNRELTFIFGKKILAQFESIIPKQTALRVREAIYKIDTEALKMHIQNLIEHTISFNTETSDKVFYHGLVLGLCAMLGSRYYVSSEHEEASGNFTIEMTPLEVRLPGILIQTKKALVGNDQQLEALARFAIKQITNKQFETEAKSRYVKTALKYGVAYSGNIVRIITE